MKIDKSRLTTLQAQMKSVIESGSATIENNIIYMIGHQYTYTEDNGIITIECITDPFILKMKDNENDIELLEGFCNGHKSKSDKTLNKFARIASALYVFMETKKQMK